jgi:hypothetical protein
MPTGNHPTKKSKKRTSRSENYLCPYCGREHERGLTDFAKQLIANFEKDRKLLEAEGKFLLVEEFLAHRVNELLDKVDSEHDKRCDDGYNERIDVINSGYHLYREMISIMKADGIREELPAKAH